jgi:hypothetical protein
VVDEANEINKNIDQTVNMKEPINNAAAKDSMNKIIAEGIFFSPTGILVSVKGARVVDRKVL